MPHPEHAVEDLTGAGTDGLGFFTGLAERRLRVNPLQLFRRVAIAEAITWALLLTGMFLKYVTETTELGVRVFGMVHGVVFIAYCLTTVLVAVDQRWSLRPTAARPGRRRSRRSSRCGSTGTPRSAALLATRWRLPLGRAAPARSSGSSRGCCATRSAARSPAGPVAALTAARAGGRSAGRLTAGTGRTGVRPAAGQLRRRAGPSSCSRPRRRRPHADLLPGPERGLSFAVNTPVDGQRGVRRRRRSAPAAGGVRRAGGAELQDGRVAARTAGHPVRRVQAGAPGARGRACQAWTAATVAAL